MEQRVIGPPGCGKTTWLSRQVRFAVEAGRDVVVASLTRAAAAEAAGRDLPLPPRNVGTLHSHCYQALDRPSLTVDKKHIEDWNDKYPQWSLSFSNDRIDEDNLDSSGPSPGDKLMATYEVLRARMATVLPIDVDYFASAWSAWKAEAGLLDFADLLEQCLDSVPAAPGNPSVIFLDEAQDMDLLEMSLARKWGAEAGYLVVVGDPDQNLYQWRGSDPEVFVEPPVPEDQMRVLSQSYRIPRAVHAAAVRWIERTPGRMPVEYYPRDEEGEVRRLAAAWPSPAIIRDMQKYLDAGKTVMVLASCAYMVRPLVGQLRREGIPYHNPYRRTKGAWNPLQSSRRRVTPKDLVLAFLRLSEQGLWTAEDMKKWLAATKITGVLQGNRATLDGMVDDGRNGVDWEKIHNLLTEEAIEAGLSGDLEWLRQNLLASRQKGAAFAIRVAEAHGAETLSKTPQIITGTIHSVKGGEADVVYLFPDLSFAGMNEWLGGGTAAVRRLFYVGMTRARETLILCEPAGSRSVAL